MLNNAMLAVVVTDAAIRSRIADALKGLSGKHGHISIDGGNGRCIIYSGPCPAGAEKPIRDIVPDGFNVSLIRNPDKQKQWTTFFNVEDARKAYAPAAKLDKAKGDKVKGETAKTPPAVVTPPAK